MCEQGNEQARTGLEEHLPFWLKRDASLSSSEASLLLSQVPSAGPRGRAGQGSAASPEIPL